MLFLFGGKDPLSPVRTAQANLTRIVDDLGYPITVKFYPNGNHGLDGESWWEDVDGWLGQHVQR